MSSQSKIIQDLIFFYVKENYKKHLEENSIEFIPEKDIMKIIDSIYTERKKHLQQFLKVSLKEIQKEEYMGDLDDEQEMELGINDDDI